MGAVVFFGVLRMPYDLVMADELSRLQYWHRGQQAAAEIERLESRVRELEDVLRAVDAKFGSRPYGAGSYIAKPLRERVHAVLSGSSGACEADAIRDLVEFPEIGQTE